MRYAFAVDGVTHHVQLEEHADGPKFLVGSDVLEPTVTKNGGDYHITVDGEQFVVKITRDAIFLNGEPLDLQVRRAKPKLIRKGGASRKSGGLIKPPMPGKIVEVLVKVGDEVKEGQVVLILEAMKMQNDLKSTVNGVVKSVKVDPGQNVEATQVLLEIEVKTEA